MSSEIAFSTPGERRAIRAAPTTPPPGPETSASDGWRAASPSVQTPPEERITSGSASPASRHRSASDQR